MAAGLAGFVSGLVLGNWHAVGVSVAAWAPAVVTYVMTHGGVKGVVSSIWTGRSEA